VCKNCAPKATEIYDRLAEETRKVEERKDELIQTCKTCQGCDDWEIICVNTECPVFYRRPKAEAEAKKLRDQLAPSSGDDHHH
jgi:DNA polymerase delta subunit 1